jgi:hypothetical protein
MNPIIKTLVEKSGSAGRLLVYLDEQEGLSINDSRDVLKMALDMIPVDKAPAKPRTRKKQEG